MFHIGGTGIDSLVIILLSSLLWVCCLLIAKQILFKAVKRLARKTQTQIDDILIKALDFPLTLVIFTSMGLIVGWVMPSAAYVSLINNFLIIFKAIIIVAIVLFLNEFLVGLIYEYSSRIEILRTSGGFMRGFVRVVIIGLGLLVLLDTFGVSITPIIASLGIGSLAIALALQPTLENFFSGIQVVVDKTVQAGQFVKLDSGEEGYVYKIGWRSTWIKMLNNNVVVVPNKVLINSKITNYCYPALDLIFPVEVGVHYQSDLDRVERVTIEVAKETLKNIPGGVKEFEPVVRYHTFNDFSINFAVALKADEFAASYLIKHEFIKRLHKRYAQEGIVIPYPIQAVNYAQEKYPIDSQERI